MYGEVEAQLRQRPQFHGALVRDLFIDFARGRFAVDDHGGKLLLEPQAAGEIERLELRPTSSQRAFAGLQVTGKAYRAQPLGSWNAEHFMWRWARPARFIHAGEMPEIMAAIELALLADDRKELHVDLLVPVAVAWVAMRARCWRRRELVAHLLAACAPWTTVVQ